MFAYGVLVMGIKEGEKSFCQVKNTALRLKQHKMYSLVLINLYVIIHMAEKLDLTMFPKNLNGLVLLLKNKITYMANVLDLAEDCQHVLQSVASNLWVYDKSPHAALDSYIKTKKDTSAVDNMDTS